MANGYIKILILMSHTALIPLLKKKKIETLSPCKVVNI